MKSLQTYSDRSLILFASMLAGQEVRVFLSDRLTKPLVVALESRSIGLQPWGTQLYDLCLGARLLRRRADGKSFGETDNIPEDVVKHWECEDNRLLQKDFPRILDLEGHHHPGKNAEPPLVVWRDVPFTKIDWNKSPFQHASMATSPGLSFQNIGDDFPGLLRAIENGQYPLQSFPDFPLPVATIPVTVTVSQAYPAELEHLEEVLSRNKHQEQLFIDCYTKKSEGMLDTELNATRFLSGLRLDHARLADAVVAQTRNVPVRLFRNKDREHHPVFQPDEHLAIHAVDLNSLGGGTFTRLRWSGHQVAFLSRIMERLEVDFALIAFADRIVDAGGLVYFHLPVTVKAVSDPFDGAFWSRVTHVFSGKTWNNLPGEPAAYHPLQMKTIDAIFRKENEEYAHAFHCLIWAAPDGMPRSMGQFHSPEYWRATAAKLDSQFADWKRDFPGAHWDNDFLFLVSELKQAARKSGTISKAMGW